MERCRRAVLRWPRRNTRELWEDHSSDTAILFGGKSSDKLLRDDRDRKYRWCLSGGAVGRYSSWALV